MQRSEFLKGLGLAGIGLAVPSKSILAKATEVHEVQGNCVLIPTEIAGPFPLDLTENTYFLRKDIREDEKGTQLNLKLKIVGLENCEPMANVRVHIWHCTNNGVYTGYNTGSNKGDVNAKDLRGYQITDSNGEVEFITIFPGWYPGRVCHIHIQVYVSTSYAAVSQFTFPEAEKNALYAKNITDYTKGKDPLTISEDGAFTDGSTHQVATLTPNTSTGGYNSYLEITVKGEGTAGVGHLEREVAKRFTLGQNFPNPFVEETTIPFTLYKAGKVKMELWDTNGGKLKTIVDALMTTGPKEIICNPKLLNLPAKSYIYQLEYEDDGGVYRDVKIMTFLP